MIHHTSYECRKCGHEIEVEVEINEGDDLPATCPECGHPTDGTDLRADAMGAAGDREPDYDAPRPLSPMENWERNYRHNVR